MACSMHKRCIEAGVSITWFNVCFQFFQRTITIPKPIKIEESSCQKGEFIDA